MIGDILHRLVDSFARNEFPVHPLAIYSFGNISEAFKYMRGANHIGKILISRVSPFDPERFLTDASCLITGGMGGIGLLCAEWAAGRGMRHIILMGRHEPPAEVLKRIDTLRENGVSVSVELGDVADQDDIRRIIDGIEPKNPPLKYIFHCAGVLSDGVISQQDWDSFEKVFKPKVYGGYNLHEMTREMDLDGFVLFSSIASIITPPGQANHAAACAYLDALARYRRLRGLPGMSINWGPWGEIGSATGKQAVKQIQSQGMRYISPDEGIDAFERIIGLYPVQAGAVAMKWDVFAEKMSQGKIPSFFTLLCSQTSMTNVGNYPGPAKESKLSITESLQSATPGRRRVLLVDHVAAIM
jgi:myxalamid-type polyketide synthase MxaB